MSQNPDFLPYEPERFARKYPNDQSLKTALNSAHELAARTLPQQPDETLIDARHRADQGFDELRTKTEDLLEEYHKAERAMFKEMFLRQKTTEINAKYQPGINATRDLDQKVGGQFAREEEIRLFQQNIGSNQDLKAGMNQLSNKQGERQEAVLNAIGEVQADFLKKHSLDGPMPQPTPSNNNDAIDAAPLNSDEFKAALKDEKAAIEQMRMNEMLIPRDFKVSGR